MEQHEMIRSPGLLSVVIPAYNEESGIGYSIDTISGILESANLKYEIIVIDDGSRDRTYEEIVRISNYRDGVKGIRLSRNFGKEAALLAGLKAAKGHAVVTIDADLQHPPEFIPEMISKWRDGAVIVHGVKRNRNEGIMYRCCANVFNLLLSKIAGINIKRSSDFKLLDRLAVDIIAADIKEHRRFYRGLSDWIGFDQTEIQFDVKPRKNGEGKWTLLSLLDLATTATISFTSAPLRVVSFLGFITLFFALIVTGETLWSWYRGVAVSGFATLEITLLLLGSFIMISLGIIGEYIAKIYDESKARPTFLISNSCGFNTRIDKSQCCLSSSKENERKNSE